MFREFKVGELFTLTGLKQVKSQKNIVESDAGIPFVIQSTKNNMVKCHADRQSLLDDGENVYEGNAIVLGVTLPAVSYQELEFGASQVITARRDDLNPARGLYLVAVMRKALLPKYSYTNKPGIQKYKEDVIQLPVKPGTDEVTYSQADIDWDYMESYIHDLEESYIRDLDAYLKETGLDDYRLTDVDHALLEREPVFGAFSVGELFDVVGRGTRITKQNRISGNVPLVTAGKENQGVAEHIQKNKQLFRGPVFTIDMFGNAFARDYDFYADDNIIVFGRDGLSINHYLYVVSALSHLSNVYGYGNQFRLNSIENTFIQLPVKSGTDSSNYTQDDIDWDYMEAYSRVMEKQVIADVVDYKNEVIALTKDVCHH